MRRFNLISDRKQLIWREKGNAYLKNINKKDLRKLQKPSVSRPNCDADDINTTMEHLKLKMEHLHLLPSCTCIATVFLGISLPKVARNWLVTWLFWVCWYLFTDRVICMSSSTIELRRRPPHCHILHIPVFLNGLQGQETILWVMSNVFASFFVVFGAFQ